MLTERVDTVILEPKRTVERIIKQINKLANEPVLRWLGDWDTLVHYEPGDVVTDGTTKWLALTKNDGITPVEGTDWTEIVGSPSVGGGGELLPLDVPPLVGSAFDDEFNGTLLDPIWTLPAVTANGMAAVVSNGWLTLGTSTPGTGALTGKYWGIRQNVPAGSFKISAKLVANRSIAATVESYDGLMVGTTGDKGHIWGMGTGSAQAMLAAMGATAYDEGASDWSAFDGYNTAAISGPWFLAWYRLRYDLPTTTLYFDYSLNGKYWNNYVSRAGVVQPNRMGIGMYSQSGGFRADKSIAAAWYRYENNSDF